MQNNVKPAFIMPGHRHVLHILPTPVHPREANMNNARRYSRSTTRLDCVIKAGTPHGWIVSLKQGHHIYDQFSQTLCYTDLATHTLFLMHLALTRFKFGFHFSTNFGIGLLMIPLVTALRFMSTMGL